MWAAVAPLTVLSLIADSATIPYLNILVNNFVSNVIKNKLMHSKDKKVSWKLFYIL